MSFRASPWSSLPLAVTAATLLAACPGDDSSTTAAGSSTGDGTTVAPPDTTGTIDPTTGGGTVADSSGGTTVGPLDSSSGGTTVDPTTGEPVVCGDGVIAGDELCDDGNTDDGDGCSATCEIDEGWDCEEEPSVCSTVCGDMLIGAPVEECDDGNMEDTDDCTNACLLPVCGDGIVWAGNEGCDDGGTDPGDGCSDLCEVEAGYLCDGAPSTCDVGIFLASGAGGTVGNLFVMSLDGTVTVDLGPLNESLTGMAFHPDGTLYAVSSSPGGSNQLGTVDTTTAQFTPIGPLQTAGGVPHDWIPDITFMGSQLVGWTESGDDLVMIDSATGTLSTVSAPEFSFGTALAYNSATDELILAPDGATGPIWTVTVGGMMSAGPTLMGTGGNSVKGMSYYDGLLYGMDTGYTGDPPGNLVTYNPMTGMTTVIAVLPSMNIDALAVYDPNNAP